MRFDPVIYMQKDKQRWDYSRLCSLPQMEKLQAVILFCQPVFSPLKQPPPPP